MQRPQALLLGIVRQGAAFDQHRACAPGLHQVAEGAGIEGVVVLREPAAQLGRKHRGDPGGDEACPAPHVVVAPVGVESRAGQGAKFTVRLPATVRGLPDTGAHRAA